MIFFVFVGHNAKISEKMHRTILSLFYNLRL